MELRNHTYTHKRTRSHAHTHRHTDTHTHTHTRIHTHTHLEDAVDAGQSGCFGQLINVLQMAAERGAVVDDHELEDPNDSRLLLLQVWQEIGNHVREQRPEQRWVSRAHKTVPGPACKWHQGWLAKTLPQNDENFNADGSEVLGPDKSQQSDERTQGLHLFLHGRAAIEDCLCQFMTQQQEKRAQKRLDESGVLRIAALRAADAKSEIPVWLRRESGEEKRVWRACR